MSTKSLAVCATLLSGDLIVIHPSGPVGDGSGLRASYERHSPAGPKLRLYVVIACCAIGRRQLEQPLTRDLINPLATQGKPHAAEEVISLSESPKHANFRLSPGAIWTVG